MFSFNFASKMLNTIMGTEETPQQPGAGGQPPAHGMGPGQPQQPGVRPMGGGFPSVRPTPQGPGGSPRPGYGGPPTFSGPRPSPGARPGPPTFGGPPRLGGPGMPHRFNGPQPAPGAQPQQRQMPPNQAQPPQQQQQQPQPMGMRGPGPMQNQGVNLGPMRPRGPPPAQQHPMPPKPGAVVPDVDLSHLSAEEREMIESVMAKAQQLEQEAAPAPPLNAALGPGQPGAQRMMRPEDQRQGADFGPRICPICRQRDMSGREGPPGQECTDCRTMVCKACGGMAPHPETKRPEWTCGNCIKRRRMGPPTTIGNSASPLGQQNLGPRPVGQFIQAPQPNNQNQANWDPNRRPSTGGVPGVQLAGSPQQQQQQRWESERESDNKIESLEVESWKNDVGQSRKMSSEIMSPPQQVTEQQSLSEELTINQGPYSTTIGLDYNSSNIATGITTNKDPYDFLSSPPQLNPSVSMSMSATTSYLPSSSVEGVNRPPSFAEVMRSRSQSIELEKGIMPEQSMPYYGGSATGSRRASADSFASIKPDRSGSYDMGMLGDMSSGATELTNTPVPGSTSGYTESLPTVSSVLTSQAQSQQQQPQPSRQVSSIDEKASSLMEELSKLQSAVDNTLKRRQRQQASQPSDSQRADEQHRFISPSPSPTSPVTNRFIFQPDSPSSPYRSPPRSDFRSPGESPDSPEVPGVRKAIVLKEHDLDDYKSSSDEESGSGSDDERKGGMMGSDAFYDHSPGEVYTIPEEEDEGGSPTGGDLVTSLNRPGIQSSLTDNGSPRRRILGQEPLSVPGMQPDQRQAIRPQLRPQRSLDNRLPSVSAPNQDNMMMANQMDPQSQSVMFPNSNNSQLTNQIGRVDNQGMASPMNVNSSMTPMGNQMNAMTSVSGTMPGMMQQQQQQNHPNSQQQQNPLQQQLQQNQQQVGFASTSAPTSVMDFHQPQNQFTVANNNSSMQQQQQHQQLPQQQQSQFGPTGGDVTTSGGNMGAGDWNSNLTITSQSVQCSSNNSVSPLSSLTDQQYSMGQTQPYQQINSFNQQTPTQQQQLQQQQTQQQQHQQQQGPLGGTTGDMTGMTSQQQSLMQQASSVNSMQSQSQQQNQMQNQMMSNVMQFQKNQMLGQNQPMQQQQSQLGLQQQQQNAAAQQQLQMQQQNQQQQLSQSMNQQDSQQQMGQMHTMMGQQQQPMSVSTSQQSFTGLQNQSLNLANTNQTQQWQQQQSAAGQMYDQNGRLIPTSSSPFAQGQQQQQQPLQNLPLNANTQQQMMNMQNQQQQQYSQQLLQSQQSQLNQHNLQQQHQQHQQPHHLGVNAPGQVPTSKSGSIGGLLADFTRALGLGTSPRPSPSEDKQEPFPVPSSGVGASGVGAHGQPSYDPFHQQQQTLSGQQVHHQHGLTSGQAQQQVQQSAFTPIHEGSLAYLQRQQQQHSYLQQQPQALQSSLGLQGLQYSSGIGLSSSSQLLSSSSQQYPAFSSQAQQQHTQVLTQGGLIAQQQTPGLGVGVVGALSPAQAHMYQQQMALQHQQQHMKKTSRRAHLSSGTGDVRRDGTTSTVLIGGQGLAIGALTPAVVTSLGTFIGGSPAVLGTSLLQQPVAVTPLGTPIGTPVGTPRSGRDPGAGDSSDTMSETDSQKSLRMRRKLPCLPPDQEAAPLPSTKKRERHRSQEFRSLSPMRLSSMDGTAAGRSYPLSSLSLSRPSASESNLRKLTMGASDPIPRPGSALGCLQASSVISSVGGKQDSIYPLGGNILSSSPAFAGMNLRTTTSGLTSDLTTTTSVLSGLYPSYKQSQDSWSSNLAELAAALPPDLRHLLNKGSGGVSDHDLSGLSGLSGLTSSLGDTSLNVGSHLPSYMRTLREQLQEERRQLLSEERRRLEALRERDRELGARLDAVTSRAGSEALRSRADLSRNGGAPRSAGASPLLNRKLKGHRRQLSDPKLSLPFSPIQEDGDSELQDFDRVTAGLLRPPYKSYEYESLEDSALLQRPATAHQVGGDWDHSQSYLASSWAAAGGALRETAITSMGGHEEDDIRNRMGSRMIGRRSSEGEAWPNTAVVTRSPSSTREKRHAMRKHRKSRSWHPSPYVSEEEDEEEEDSLSREEKKARIKAEIARRRQQIQERAGLHGELISASSFPGGVTEHERHSVLKSVDQLLRDQYGRYESSSGLYGRAPSSVYHSTVPGPGGYANSGGGRPMNHHHHHHHHHHSHQPHHLVRMTPSGHVISPSASEEDRSIERIASTFRSSEHDYASMLYDRLGEMSPLATDSESMGSELGAPAAMPILPDMPTRSRRLLEDLGSAPIGLNEGIRGASSSGQSIKGRSAPIPPSECSGGMPTTRRRSEPKKLVAELTMPPPTPRRSSSHHPPTQDNIAAQYDSSPPGSSDPSSRRSSRSRSLVSGTTQLDVASGGLEHPHASSYPEQSRRKSSDSHRSHRPEKKYSFPVKKYWLSRDPKDRSVGSNGVGMRICGGKELPDCGEKLAAYVTRIFPGGLVERIGGINEGDVIVEWAGHSLGNKTFEEVQSILESTSTKEEFDIVIRTDFNFKSGKPQHLVSGVEEDYSRRQSDCGSVITDSQSICMPQQDTTDDNESDKSRHAEGTYSSSCTLASECTATTSTAPKAPLTASTKQLSRDEFRKTEHAEERPWSYKSPSSTMINASVANRSIHQSTLAVDESSCGDADKLFRRHSAMSLSSKHIV